MSLKQTVENVYIRQEAVQLTRRYFWRLLGMIALITTVVSAAEYFLNRAGDVINGAEIQAVQAALQRLSTAEYITSTRPFEEAMTALFTSPRFWLFNLAYMLLSFLLSQGLMLGRLSQEIAAAQGKTPRVTGLFSRLDCCVKAVGLVLLTGVRIFLWLLPGLAACFIAAELRLYGQMPVSPLMTMLGVGLLFGFGIPAVYSYMMAPYILADESDRGVRECITLSTGLMKYCKWQYFKLCVPMWLKLLGTMYAEMLILSLLTVAIGENPGSLGTVIVLLVSVSALLLPSIYFILQMNLACALFYLKRKHSAADAKPSYWLQDHSTPEEQPADPSPETNDKKENPHEQSDC